MASYWGAAPAWETGAAKDSGRAGADLLHLALDSLALHRSRSSSSTSSGISIDSGGSTPAALAAARNWRKVALDARRTQADPWRDMALNLRPERAVEHLYDARTQCWSQQPLLVSGDLSTPVAQGRMRQCFRLKRVVVQGSSDLVDFADLRGKSALEALPHLGRRSACRVRGRLGLPQVGFRHPTVLTVGELVDASARLGARHVCMAVAEECHGMREDDVQQLMQLLARGERDADCWARPSRNVMVKRYMKPEDDVAQVYRDDVAMQEVCKLLCQRFNLHEPPPPKRIDMLHVGVIELVQRPGRPLFGYESFVQGTYRKWNTNAGWREVGVLRHTPQAFSFASFRLTAGQLMVVDMQGVNDLYTDPQVHSLDAQGFGEGNLGARGMALFLAGFRYDLNPIVQHMNLPPFALTEQPEPTPEERRKYEEGRAYLASKEWRQRATYLSRGVSAPSPSAQHGLGHGPDHDQRRDAAAEAAQGRDADVEEAMALARMLAKCASSCPVGSLPPFAQVPSTTSAEAVVHLELAKLLAERDERVAVQGDLAAAAAERFHVWMAALGGSLPACERLLREQEDDGEHVQAWAEVAAARGSRPGAVRLADLLERQGAKREQEERLVAALDLALAADDGKSDAQRRADFEARQHDLRARRARALQRLGRAEEARGEMERAAEEALEAGDFKAHQRLIVELEELIE